MPDRAPLTDDEALLRFPAPGISTGAEDDATLLARMQAELREGFRALAGVQQGISVFGSARTPPRDPDYRLARDCAARLGREGYAIVTGGGSGIMEAANRGARDSGALSVGLAIELPSKERTNPYLDRVIRFHYFFTRKVMFVRYASAFLVFPGGFGTLDELLELAALMQTRKVRSSPVVLVRRAYWEPLMQWLRDTVLAEGKISPGDLDLLAFADDGDEVLALLEAASGRI